MSEPDEFIVKDTNKRCRGCGKHNYLQVPSGTLDLQPRKLLKKNAEKM
jgi:hypothetical protein